MAKMKIDPEKERLKKELFSKVDDTSLGGTPKPYPKKRNETVDRNGDKVTTISNSENNVLFSGKNRDPKTKDAVRAHIRDSTNYAQSADYQAKQYNNKVAYENAMAFAGKKKK